MAAVSYTIKVGDVLEGVLAGTNAPSAGQVELRIADQAGASVTDKGATRGPKKSEVQVAIRILEQYLLRDTNLID
jgi:hypothetical protein